MFSLIQNIHLDSVRKQINPTNYVGSYRLKLQLVYYIPYDSQKPSMFSLPIYDA